MTLDYRGGEAMRAVAISFVAALLAASAAVAEPAPQYSASEAVKALTGGAPIMKAPATEDCAPDADGACQPAVSVRGFSLPSAAHAQPVSLPALPISMSARRSADSTARAALPARPQVTAGDLLITFKLGSAELTDQGRANARSFGAALSDSALAGRFEIAGHTDATGSAEKNLELSKARAETVKAFLASQGVDPSRLESKGYGSQDLADPSAPASGVNRRVEVKRIG